MSVVAERVGDEPVEVEQKVTPLELFFDLVFVFAITQVAGFIAVDPTWTRLVESLAVLAALWWAWVAYVWLGNNAASDEGVVRVVLLSAMAAMLVASLAVPHAFGRDGLVFGVAFLLVRALHLSAYWLISRDDAQMRAVIERLATTILPAAALLVLAGALDGTAQALCWAAALAVDYGGILARGTAGWRVHAGHFAERHGLIILIALGESIVSLGVGAGDLKLDAGLIVAALLGMAVAASLWWAYFDFVAIAAERRLRTAPPEERVRLARDSYSYLHLPMVAGIVLFALGVKKTLGHFHSDLEGVPAVALCAGVAMYFAALSAFKRRNIGSWNGPRLIAAAILLALIPLATAVDAIVALALVAVTSCALIAYETVSYATYRDRVRHG